MVLWEQGDSAGLLGLVLWWEVVPCWGGVWKKGIPLTFQRYIILDAEKTTGKIIIAKD